MSNFIVSSLFAATALCAAVAPVAAGAAQPSYEVSYAVVSTAGLDLTTAQGLAELKARIRSTADRLCGEPTDYEPATLAAIRKCRINAIADTEAQVQSAVQTASAQRPQTLRVSAIDQH